MTTERIGGPQPADRRNDASEAIARLFRDLAATSPDDESRGVAALADAYADALATDSLSTRTADLPSDVQDPS